MQGYMCLAFSLHLLLYSLNLFPFSGFQPLPSPSSGYHQDASTPSVHEFQPPLMPPALPPVAADGSGATDLLKLRWLCQEMEWEVMEMGVLERLHRMIWQRLMTE